MSTNSMFLIARSSQQKRRLASMLYRSLDRKTANFATCEVISENRFLQENARVGSNPSDKVVISCARIFSSLAADHVGSSDSSSGDVSSFFTSLREMKHEAQTKGKDVPEKPVENRKNKNSKDKLLKKSYSSTTPLMTDMDALHAIASRKTTPLSLADMYRYASIGSDQRLRNAQFLHRELPIRLAQRAIDLLTLPHGLSKTRHIRNVAHKYLTFLQQFQQFPCPQNDEDEMEFTNLLQGVVLDRASIPHAIALGVKSLKDKRRESFDSNRLAEMEEALYRFFTARVGLRFLTAHHILCSSSPQADFLRKQHSCLFGDVCTLEDQRDTDQFLGCIKKNCNPVEEVNRVVKQVTRHCMNSYGISPEVEVVDCTTKGEGKDFTYVPHHLRYMVAELLQNSCRATVRRYLMEHEPEESIPPITVIVVKGDEDVTIKVADTAGGLPRSEIKNLWTFATSTLNEDVHGGKVQETDAFASNGFTGSTIRGFGLPLARIYARYFGGEITLKSMEGYGVDAYLYLPMLGSACENLSETVAKSPGNLDSNVNSSWDFQPPSESPFSAGISHETMDALNEKAL